MTGIKITCLYFDRFQQPRVKLTTWFVDLYGVCVCFYADVY